MDAGQPRLVGSGTVRLGMLIGLLLIGSYGPRSTHAATFEFGVGASFGTTLNGLTGQNKAALTRGSFDMQLSAGPVAMAGLVENSFARGLGVDSGAAGGSANGFDVLGGSSPGEGEFIEFSFNQQGMITGLNLDGVKDELLEYFHLQSNGGVNVYFFDSRANMPDLMHPTYEHPLDAALDAGAIVGDVVILMEQGSIDDEVYGLQIPFTAGQVFRLTYNSVGPPYAQGSPNGARLYAIEVGEIPEPATATVAVFAALLYAAFRIRR